jgi:beta-lactamase regulating signal transducer with metallopeptidase domain/biopolymer transport protein ExbD
MIGLLDAWGASWTEYFGPAVLQNTLFLGLIFLALYILRNTRASLRYALCLIGMVKLLLPPFLPTGFVETPDRVIPVVSLVGLLPGAASSTISPVAESGPGPHIGLPGLLFAVWAAVAILHLVHAALSAARLRRELKSAIPVRGPADRLPTGRSVEVMKAEAIPVPLTFGLFHPKVYVPEAWHDWNERCRRMVLAHELAHIRRWDRLGQMLQVAVKALYFFHPLVWLLDRRMNKYREMACDDAVTENSATEAVDYSRHLAEIAERVASGRGSWRSASAFLKHRNGLLDRVRYQLEVKEMKAISARTKALLFTGLLLLVLPLSWYCGKAETEEVLATAGSAPGETPKSMEAVTVVLMPDQKISVDGELAATEELGGILEARFPSDRDNVLVRLSCEEAVAMERVSEVHKILVDLGLVKVVYEGAPEEDLPLVLPSIDAEKKLAWLDREDVAVLKVDLPGRAVLDGKPLKVTEVQQAIRERLAENPHLVVSLVWAPTASYDDFILVLALVKAAGANRIAVPIGS